MENNNEDGLSLQSEQKWSLQKNKNAHMYIRNHDIHMKYTTEHTAYKWVLEYWYWFSKEIWRFFWCIYEGPFSPWSYYVLLLRSFIINGSFYLLSLHFVHLFCANSYFYQHSWASVPRNQNKTNVIINCNKLLHI